MTKLFIVASAAVCLSALSAPAMAFDWNGFYAGVSAGYVTGTSEGAYDDPQLASFNVDTEPAGWLLGVQAGVNQAMGGVILGLEGDLSLADITDTIDDELGNTFHPQTGPHTVTGTTDWTGSLRGRIGFDAGGMMPYLTAGIAAANVTVNATDGDIEDSAMLTGWTAGAGVEVPVTDNMSVKLEALFTDLGEHTWFEGEDYSSTVHSTSTTVRAGINFAFD